MHIHRTPEQRAELQNIRRMIGRLSSDDPGEVEIGSAIRNIATAIRILWDKVGVEVEDGEPIAL